MNHAVNRKLPEMAMLASKDFTTGKKVTPNGAPPDDHWIKSLIEFSCNTQSLAMLAIFYNF